MKPKLLRTAIASTWLAMCLVVGAEWSIAADRPAAPPGFAWYKAKNGVGTFLRPDGWHVREDTKNGTKAVFISREDIAKTGRFSVGLSVNRITAFSRRSNASPNFYAKAFIARMVRTYETLKAGEVRGNQDIMYVARIVGMNGNVRTIVHHIAVGRDDEDDVFLISFETPEDEWKPLYGIAGSMLNYFILGS